MSLVIQKTEDWTKLMSNPDMVYVVDFTATWCGPCRAIGPLFEELSMRPAFAGIAFLKVDVDKLPEVATLAKVSAMPTFQVWHNGRSVDEMVGASKDKLTTLVTKALSLVPSPP
jgi:thioredoxin 1